MKWIEDVTYLDFYGDYRFALKIYNVADEFQFRTRDEESAQHWVATLKSAVDATLSGRKMQDSGGVRTGGKSVGRDTNNTSRTAWGDFVPAGVEQGDKALNGTLPASGSRAMSPNTNTEATNFPGSQSEDNSHNSASSRVKPLQEMTIKELRALAHSVGIGTFISTFSCLIILPFVSNSPSKCIALCGAYIKQTPGGWSALI